MYCFYVYLCVRYLYKPLKPKKMKFTIKLLKNDKCIKQLTLPMKYKNKAFDKFYDLAGSMFNGKDKFSVELKNKLYNYK